MTITTSARAARFAGMDLIRPSWLRSSSARAVWKKAWSRSNRVQCAKECADAEVRAVCTLMASATRPFSRFEWMLAGRYLRAKRAESFVSVISGFSLVGIALGVATLIIVMSVMNGFRHDLLSRILGLKGHVIVQGLDGGNAPISTRWPQRVRAVPGVMRVAPIVEGQVMATSNGASLGALVRGMRRDDLENAADRFESLSPGALARFEGGDSVIVGAAGRQVSSWRQGMTITLIAPRGNVTPFGITPRIKTYTIAGTFKIGMSVYDSSYVFMPLEEAQLYFNMGSNVSALEVMITDPDKADTMANAIGTAGPMGTRIVTWQDMNSSLFGALQVERNVMFLILTLIILVAALNIVSGLIMLVKDKGRRHRHPAHDGRDARRGDARISSSRAPASASPAPCSALSSACCSAPTSKTSVSSCRRSPARHCSIRKSISSAACRPKWIRAR